MKRTLALVAVLLAVATHASAAPLTVPPAQLTPAEAGRYFGSPLPDPVLVAAADGRQQLVGFLATNVPGHYAGAYFWSALTGTYEEFFATRGGITVHGEPIPLAATVTSAHRATLRTVILLVSADLANTARSRRHPAAAVAPTARPTPAATPRPVIPQPTFVKPTFVKPTFLDRTLLATSSPIAAVWNEHRFLSILAFVLVGCVLGARARTCGPRPIEIRQDDVLAALAVSERKLSASRARLQQLSSAIDAEESQFVQRVSAIVERR